MKEQLINLNKSIHILRRSLASLEASRDAILNDMLDSEEITSEAAEAILKDLGGGE